MGVERVGRWVGRETLNSICRNVCGAEMLNLSSVLTVSFYYNFCQVTLINTFQGKLLEDPQPPIKQNVFFLIINKSYFTVIKPHILINMYISISTKPSQTFKYIFMDLITQNLFSLYFSIIFLPVYFNFYLFFSGACYYTTCFIILEVSFT